MLQEKSPVAGLQQLPCAATIRRSTGLAYIYAYACKFGFPPAFLFEQAGPGALPCTFKAEVVEICHYFNLCNATIEPLSS